MGRVAALNVLWFALSVSSNTLDPIILPLLVQNLVSPDVKATSLAGLGTAGLVVAMIWQPVVGALSDRASGGRLPFLIAGVVALTAGLPLMALAPSFSVLLLVMLGLQLASNTIQGPLQALVSDYLPWHMWGRAAGLRAVFEVGGIVIGGYVGGRLVASGMVPGAFGFVAGVLLAGLALTVAGLKRMTPERRVHLGGPVLPETFRQSLRALAGESLRPYFWWLVNRYLFIVGLTTIRVFGFYYVQDYLGLPNAAAVVGNLIAVIGLVVLVVALPAGALADRIGRRQMMIVAGLLATLAAPLLLVVHTPAELMVVGALIGMAAAVFQSVGWAMAMELVPAGQVGRYLGLSNIASAGGSMSARLGGPVIDALNAQDFGRGYTALFMVNIALFALATMALFRIRPRGDLQAAEAVVADDRRVMRAE